METPRERGDRHDMGKMRLRNYEEGGWADKEFTDRRRGYGKRVARGDA